MNNHFATMGFVELYIGPMFSGKTSLLLSKISQYKGNIFVITHSSDTRYGENQLISHDKASVGVSAACTSLMPLLDSEDLAKASYVAIEEAQFFGDTVEFVKHITTTLGKHVFVAGLDGDYKMDPFRTVTDLIPFADVVVKLHARCSVCNCPAPFTMRTLESKEQVLVGAGEMYKPVCRQHRL
jgi:thymidine kinase